MFPLIILDFEIIWMEATDNMLWKCVTTGSHEQWEKWIHGKDGIWSEY